MTTNRALITGICGFCGWHLARHLAEHTYDVFGIDLVAGGSIPDISVYVGDLRDPAFVQAAVLAVRPTHIFHLAALTDPQADLRVLCDVNVCGTGHLLEAVHRADLDPVVLIVGTSAAYGLVAPDDLPIRESQPFRPVNAYAVSKIAQEMLAYTYHTRYGMRVIRTRAFNLIGPGQPSSLACSAFAQQIAEIEVGHREPVLQVGNLAPERDFVDVRDAVHAYRLIAEQGEPGGVYNVCSGQAISIQTCVKELLELTQTPIRIERERTLMRLVDIPRSIGDADLLHRQTGWQPLISLEQSLADLLDDWRRRIREV
jgi:GDP-4-dehydro-6-deoxy-D-mannose reductase